MDGTRFALNRLAFALVACIALLGAGAANAGVFEIGGTISYGRANLGRDAYTRQNRYTIDVAWRFTKVSAIELAYMRTRTKMSQPVYIDSVLFGTLQQSVTLNDQVYSASWVQNLVPANFIIQPYFKIGGGRLVRKQLVEYSNVIPKQEVSQETDTGVAGLGARFFMTKNMALKGEFVTYVPKFRFSQWKESQMFSVGLSWVF